MKTKTQSAKKTRKLGARLAQALLQNTEEDSSVFSLEGKLGAGKTTFIKGLAAELGVEKEIKSPSFVLVKKYQPSCAKFEYLFHIDCYRLSGNTKELSQIAFKDILDTPNSLVVIEWGEKIETLLPENYYKIRFNYAGEGMRELNLPAPFFSYD